MKTFVGIDIGTSSVKIVEAGKNGNSVEIVRAHMFPATSKALFSEAVSDHEELARQLRTGYKDSGISTKNVNISLMESHVFTRIIEMPLLSDKELIQALRWEAERYVPLPLDEVNMDFSVLVKKPEKKTMEILLVASAIRFIEKYMKILELAGLTAVNVENEALPLLRVFKNPGSNRMLVDIGDTSTNIFLIQDSLLSLARPVGIGGSMYTKALISELNLPLSQAEEYKKTYGLTPGAADGRVLQVLSPLVDSLVSEINQSLTYFKERYPDQVVNQVIVTGGGSMLPGLLSYISEKLQMETLMGNPWQHATVSKGASQYQSSAVFFSVATGLALLEAA
jgi:type IV pilus assembly protein PilM